MIPGGRSFVLYVEVADENANAPVESLILVELYANRSLATGFGEYVIRAQPWGPIDSGFARVPSGTTQDSQMLLTYTQDADGNEALCVSCSCHPSKGGLFLDASVKYSLSLSQCYYLYEKEEYAEVAKRYGISTLKIENI